MELTEAENIKKNWQEYKEPHKKDLNDLDNHNDVVTYSWTSWRVKSSGSALLIRLAWHIYFSILYFI